MWGSENERYPCAELYTRRITSEFRYEQCNVPAHQSSVARTKVRMLAPNIVLTELPPVVCDHRKTFTVVVLPS